MGLLESAILSLCVHGSQMDNQACTSGIEAGAKQTGIEQTMDTYENRKIKLLEKDAYATLGKDNVQIVGGTVWITKSLVDRHATFGLPNLGLCDKLVTEVNTNEAKLVFKWNF